VVELREGMQEICFKKPFKGNKGRAIANFKEKWWDAGMVMCLGQSADLHMAQLMPLPLTISCSSKSRLVLPPWFYLSGAGSPE